MNEIPLDLAPGDRVRLLEGTFSRFEADVTEVDTSARVIHVVLSIYGRSIPFQFTFDDVPTALERAEN
jgi:transcription antitermination factor NusG